jgi:natural resistance-associated macrophage protein
MTCFIWLIVQHSGLLTQAIGVLGAIIMPHNLFLHSALVQSRRVDHRNKGAVRQANMYYTVESSMALVCTFVINMCVVAVFAKGFHGRPDIKPEDIGLHNAGAQAPFLPAR